MALLPNGGKAIVDLQKLVGYCLNTEHPKGGPKARVFRSFLGLTVDDAEMLRTRLLEAAQNEEAVLKGQTEYGTRYEMRFLMTGPNGNQTEVLAAWFYDTDSDAPRLVSSYIDL